MRKITSIILICTFFNFLSSITLQQMFDEAESFNEFDKYITLEKNQVYTGSLGIYEGSVFIDGKGAIIDLENGGGIWVYGSEQFPSSLIIKYATVKNGANYGITYAGSATGFIENCNFYNNDYGAKFYDYVEVEIKNCNFVHNTTFGLGIYSLEPIIDISYSNFWNNLDNDLMENCPN